MPFFGCQRISRVKRFQICLVVSAFLVLFSMEREMMMNSSNGAVEDVDVKKKPEKNNNKNNTTFVTSISGDQAPSSHNDAKSPSNMLPTMPSGPPPTTITESSPTWSPVQIESPQSNPSSLSSSSSSLNTPPSNFQPSPTTTTTTTSHIDNTSNNNNNNSPDTAPSNATSSLSFVDEHCDIAPLKQWYPNDNEAWQLRAPYVIVAGVWNAGIKDVSTTLTKISSSIASSSNSQQQNNNNNKIPKQVLYKSKYNGFFLPKQFYRLQQRSKTKVFAVRQRMYAQMYNTKLLKEQQQQVSTSSSSSMYYYMDVSPGYLFYPKTIYPILCTAPWTKFIVVLRNPFDRLYRQWVYGQVHLKLTLSLEDWMARDMKVMQSVGLLLSSGAGAGTGTTTENDNTSTSSSSNIVMTSGMDQERQAWKDYQSATTTVSGAVGRSMYVLQLQEWFDALYQAGKNPKDVMYIVPSEVLYLDESDNDSNATKIQQEYTKLFEFLKLPAPTSSFSILDHVPRNNNNPNNNLPPIQEDTKKNVDGIFCTLQ